MPFARPTLTDLIARVASDIEAGLPGTDARLRRSNLGVLSRVMAAATHGLYGFLDYRSRQMMPDTAETDYLDRHAAIYAVLRKPASFAQGNVLATGTTGTVVPASTQLLRADGRTYVTTADVTLAGGTAVLAVVAEEPGADGNATVGTVLGMTQPIGGVEASATVQSGGLAGAADAETDAALRGRVLARIQAPPNGGAASDYVAWALEVPGVTRAWVYPLEDGVGTVRVRFVRDLDASLIPSGPEVAEVQAHIDAVRPVCANVTVSAPTAVPLNLTIALTPNTAAVKDAVTAELQDLLLRESSPGGTLLLSQIREAISIAAGEVNYVMSTPTADVTRSAGQITTLGTITWS